MSSLTRLGGWLLVLSLSGNGHVCALASPASAVSVIQNSTDEAALQALAAAFYKAWATKDADGYWSLWSAQAPELAAHRKAMQGFFANREQIELRGLTMRAAKLDGDKARARVEFDARLIRVQTGNEQGRYFKSVQLLEWMKEAGRWKIWRETSAFEQLAAALVAAKSEPERAALLAGEQELVTAELVHALNVHGNRLPYPQSLVANQLALSIGEQLGDKMGVARTLSNIGFIHQAQGDLVQALAHYQLALSISEQLGDKMDIARTLNNIGGIYQSRGDMAQALAHYQQSLTQWEALGNKTQVARTLNFIGNIHRLRGDYAPALERYQQSLAMSEALGDKLTSAQTLNHLGLVHLFQGNHAQALAYSRQSLTMSEALGNKAEIASALYNLGRIHHAQSSFAEALEHFRKSLALREALGYKAPIADTLFHIANVRSSQGDNAQALADLRQSLAISEGLGDKAIIARTLNSIGGVYAAQGNHAQAFAHHQRSLTLSEAMGAKAIIAGTLNSIGGVHLAQGNYAQALEHYRKSLALQEAIGDKSGIAVMLNNIGVAYNSQGDYTQAAEYFQKTLPMLEALGARVGIARTLNNLGRVQHAQGNYAPALAYLQKSLALSEAVGDKAGTARVLSNIGEVYEQQGQYAQALDFAERATDLARQVGDTDPLRKARLLAGTAHRALKQPAQARQAFEEAIAISEILRAQVAGGEEAQQSFFASKVAPYHAMADLLAREGKAAEALTFAERAKSRVLLDVLQTGRINITKALTSEEQEQERKLRVELSALNNQVARLSPKPDQARLSELKTLREKARLNYEALQTALRAAHPELRVQRGEAAVIKAEELAALVPDATSALLEYVVTDDVTYLFAVTKAAGKPLAEVRVYALPIKRDALGEQTESLRRQLAGRDLGFRAAARQLYQLLFKPAQTQLQGKTKLVIVPDDKLWELPFQALLGAGDRYVIETSHVSYAPSLTVLREMKTQRSKRRAQIAPAALLALGNPALGRVTVERAKLALRDGKLDPLPEAEAEVKALGRLYGATRSKIYVGAEAREDRAKTEAAQANILHFATHGILNDAAPLYSHLVLAQGDSNEDGLLEAWELMQLDLQADLAVLSACETARGRASAGEGVIGLTWALFVAGVPATVVSQWKVEAASTRDLMMDFHRALNAGAGKTPPPKAAALRQAALRLMKQPATSHPFYWAGFVLIGADR